MVSGIPPYIGPWNQNVRSCCLCGLLSPKTGLYKEDTSNDDKDPYVIEGLFLKLRAVGSPRGRHWACEPVLRINTSNICHEETDGIFAGSSISLPRLDLFLLEKRTCHGFPNYPPLY